MKTKTIRISKFTYVIKSVNNFIYADVFDGGKFLNPIPFMEVVLSLKFGPMLNGADLSDIERIETGYRVLSWNLFQDSWKGKLP